jgi:hypothetical protein
MIVIKEQEDMKGAILGGQNWTQAARITKDEIISNNLSAQKSMREDISEGYTAFTIGVELINL